MRIRGALLESTGGPRPYEESRPLRVVELELDPPGRGEILVRIECAGLCHSDLSVINGDRPRPTPMLLGHEAAGIVEVIGDDVSDLAVGDRVVMTFLPRCGACSGCSSAGRIPCVAGSQANAVGSLLAGGRRLRHEGTSVNHHLGVSAFATAAIVDRRSVVPVSSDVPADVAALLGCAILTGGGAVLNVDRPRPGSVVCVVGLGGVGMAALLVALALAEVTVIGIDPDESKRATAARLGAIALHPDEAVREGRSGDLVVEAAGSAAALETAIALTAPGGSTVTVGLPHPDTRVSIDPLRLVAEGRRIVGSYLGSAVPERDIPAYVAMWREGRLPVEELISGRMPLDRINEGMDELADGRAIRQVVDLGDHGGAGR